MRVEIYAHANAHDDVDAATERCLAYCDAQGWKRPHPMVTRPGDPVSPDLMGVLMSDRLDALVVPRTLDLVYAGVDFARQRTSRRPTVAEAKLSAVAAIRAATVRIMERGGTLCIIEEDIRIEGPDVGRFVETLDFLTQTVTEWNANEKENRSIRSKDALKKARDRGTRLGRPPKEPGDERPEE